MKTMLKANGLSAKRKTTYKLLNTFFGLLLVLLFFLSACHEKTRGQHPEEKKTNVIDNQGQFEPA